MRKAYIFIKFSIRLLKYFWTTLNFRELAGKESHQYITYDVNVACSLTSYQKGLRNNFLTQNKLVRKILFTQCIDFVSGRKLYWP